MVDSSFPVGADSGKGELSSFRESCFWLANVGASLSKAVTRASSTMFRSVGHQPVQRVYLWMTL